MTIKPNSTLLFIGDSITDCEREWPVGRNDGLGNGYVSIVDATLAASHPETRIRVLNTGVSGNRVTDLASRWEADVFAHKPDWLSVMIGINDVWRQFDRALDPGQVEIDEFEAVYRSLLMKTRAKLHGLILMSPYFIEPNRDDPMRRLMDDYGAVVARLAPEFDALFVDVQAAFDAYLESRSSHSLAADRVHPNRTGHLIIGQAFLRAIGAS